MMRKERNVKAIESEIENDCPNDFLSNVLFWSADISIREVVSVCEDDGLLKPELQCKYVWDRAKASKFMETILLGLPTPSIFLAQAGGQKLIVDGYQRIATIYDYVKRGVFSADGKIFKLSDSVNHRWKNKAFEELSGDERRRINDAAIHAVILAQKKPEKDITGWQSTLWKRYH